MASQSPCPNPSDAVFACASIAAAEGVDAPPPAGILQARETALRILQPTRRDLEHGLELHREALVVDAYGFAPRAGPDPERLRALHDQGASDLELQDAQEDMRMTRAVEDREERIEFIRAWNAAGVTCVLQNSGEEGNDPMRLLKRLARFTHLSDHLPGVLRRCVSPDDILQAKQERLGGLYFTGNGVPLAQAWVSVEDELRYVRVFFQLGIRMMHLTYNRRNPMGDGCAETANGGLSDFGRAAVAEMNRVGVIVDVAHAGWQTSLEAAQVSSKPMVASHTTCAAVQAHIRAKPDDVIRAICDTGGYIGICCVPRFLGHSGDIQSLLDHIDHAAKIFGTAHVAIGTDAAYTSQYAGAGGRAPVRKQRPRWEALWPPDDFQATTEMNQSLAWTNWPLFTVGLVQRGYADDDIIRILGGNVLRVARAVLASPAP